MARTKSDNGTFILPKKKTTSIGDGQYSRPKRRGKKAYRGQGKR